MSLWTTRGFNYVVNDSLNGGGGEILSITTGGGLTQIFVVSIKPEDLALYYTGGTYVAGGTYVFGGTYVVGGEIVIC